MELNDFEKDIFRDLTWFEPERDFTGAGLTMRPYSLASEKGLGLMSLTLMSDKAELEPEEESRQINAFIWLHSAPIPEICEALWSGTWRAGYELAVEQSEEVITEFRRYRARVLGALAASDYTIMPDKDARPLPPAVIGPSNHAFSLSILLRTTKMSREEILWHLWLPQALQLEMAALRWEGLLTVAKGRETNSADYQDTVPDFLKENASDQATASK